MKLYKIVALACLLWMVACQNEPIEKEKSETVNIEKPPRIEYLPLLEYDLSDMSQWKTDGTNWSIVGGVKSDMSVANDLRTTEGVGVLVNNVEGTEGVNIATLIEHGDLEMELEVLVPKGSNSGIYLQSRYELQIRDSAGDSDVTSDDMGGMYSTGEGDPGSPPMIDAARAPGLWQTLRFLFRAPKFDASGKKIADAKLDYVYLNDFLIHKDLVLKKPTLGAVNNEEVAMAPLLIQGDHGPVAFRNIKYKVFDQAEVTISNINYNLYLNTGDEIPDFSKLQVAKSGTMIDFEDLEGETEQKESYSLLLNADVTVPRDGDYLFETLADDGVDLYIDDKLVSSNIGDPGWGVVGSIVNLTTGVHDVRLEYYQVTWRAALAMKVEGPGIEKHDLPKKDEDNSQTQNERKRMTLDVGDTPELIRSFANHGDVKKTHVMSVGNPSGVHYSFDTRRNQLLNVWKGDFADATEMWVNRGEPQRLRPMGAVLMLPVDESLASYKPRGYQLGEDGLPVFEYTNGSTTISDKTMVNADGTGVIRNINVTKGSAKLQVAAGDEIYQGAGGWYVVDHRYYVRPVKDADKYSVTGGQLIADVGANQSVEFEILW